MLQDITKRLVGLLAAVALIAITGCGESTGSVHGKVYLQDTLVTAGSVAFTPPDEKVATAEIQPDGSYNIPKVSPGVSKIAVMAAQSVTMPPEGKMMDPGKMGAADKGKGPEVAKGKSVPIPVKYADAQKSGLTFTVKAGPQEHDIKLP
jgi:hypothetical protein